MTIQVHFLGGEHISAAAKRLCAWAAEHGSAWGDFNEITLQAKRGSTPEMIVADFERRCNERAEAYRKSPEGIADAKRSAEEVANLQTRHDELLAALSVLDFSNDVAVMDWLCEMQPASDRVGVKIDKRTILSAFAAAGLTPNMNCGQFFDENDRANYHRWIVGQALDGLEKVAIHGMICVFAERWKVHFGIA